MPTTHTTTVSQERLDLLYVIVRGLPIDVGSIIAKKIRECAVKTHRTTALLFPSLVISICVISGVRLEASDDHIKNDGAFTACTIERVAGESAGTTTEPAAVTGAWRTIGLEQTIQALSTSINQCVEAQQKKNGRFWSYLQHLDSQLHQFALYMKRTHRNLPESLLQQYNFDTNTTGAPVETSDEATATDAPAEETEPQAMVDSEDAETSDPPEDGGDKFETDNLPSEAEDNSEQEREEPTIPAQSKTWKQHLIQEEEEPDLEDEPTIPVFVGKGKEKGKAKMAIPPTSEGKMEQIDAELATATAKVTPTTEQTKQLLAIIAAITVEGQAADASTPIPSQSTPSQPIRTSPRQSNKRKGSTFKGPAIATPSTTPFVSPATKNTLETLDEKEEERRWPQKKKSTIGNNTVLLRMLKQPMLQQSGSNAGEI